MNRPLLFALAVVAVVVAAGATAFALTNDDSEDSGATTADGPERVVRSDGGIPKDQCNWIHNIHACGPAADEAIIAGTPMKAVDHLANRLGVDTTDVRVLEVKAVNWPDACLGLSTPATFCAQVVTPGYRVVLEVGGQKYVYRTDRGEHVVPE